VFPPAPFTERICTKEYTIPDTDVIIRKGNTIEIPIFSLHRDPDHFTDPEKFDPERFCSTRINTIKPYSFMPFGHGPRNCIGI
jgi:cytochrome P450 family 6